MATTRPQIKAAIKECIKYVLEESWGVEPGNITCKIFSREAKLGIYDILVISKEELWELSIRHESSNAVHLASVEAGRIRIFMHCKMNLWDQRLCPDDRLFRFASVALHDHTVFRMHPNNLAILSQAGEIKVITHRSLLPPTTPMHQLTLAEMIKKSIKRDASLLSNFKDWKFRYN